MSSSLLLRWLTALTLGIAAASCSVIFDYGDDPSAGGASASTSVGGAGGAGGGVDCGDGLGCDDQNDCTIDDCPEGLCKHTPVADDTVCQKGGNAGVCASGACIVACTGDDPTVCDDDSDCTIDSCDVAAGQCVNEPVPDGPTAAQTAGDCQVMVCSAGVLQAENDDNDPFIDGEACTHDLCDNGTPSNPPVAAGTECGVSLVCDDAGVCVGCNTASDCAGNDTFCQTITCSGQGQCGVSNTPAGTPLPAADQTAGPCKEIQCNGSGGQQTVNKSNGTSCSDGLYCNGTDSCLSGNCSQHTGNPCPGPDGDTNCAESCNETNDNCTANDPNGSSCNDGLYCNGTDTCMNGSCAHSGDPCASQVGDGDADCSEACNEATDACTANDPAGASCTDGLYCNGADSCDGSGNCAQHNGDPCLPVFGGSCFSSCNEMNDNCSALDPYQTPCGAGGCCSSSGNCGVCL